MIKYVEVFVDCWKKFKLFSYNLKWFVLSKEEKLFKIPDPSLKSKLSHLLHSNTKIQQLLSQSVALHMFHFIYQQQMGKTSFVSRRKIPKQKQTNKQTRKEFKVWEITRCRNNILPHVFLMFRFMLWCKLQDSANWHLNNFNSWPVESSSWPDLTIRYPCHARCSNLDKDSSSTK